MLKQLASLSIRQRMLLLIAGAGVPGIAIAVYLAVSWLQAETAQIEVTVERLAKLAAARQDTVIENARVVVTAVAERLAANDARAADCREYLRSWLEQFAATTSLSLFDRQGLRICAADGVELPSDASERGWFEEAREATGFTLGGYSVGESGTPLLVAAYPIRRGDSFRGAVALGIDLRWLNFLSQTIELPEDTTVTALGSGGEVLLHNAADPSEDVARVGALPSQQALSEMSGMTSGTLRTKNAAESPRIYGVQKTSSGDMVVAVGHTPYLDYATYREALLHTLLAPLTVLLLALIAAGYASEAFVARYVRALTRTAEAIEEGDLSARTEIPYSRYEIGRLAAAFDGMAAAIEHDEEELKSLVEQREMLIRELNHRVKNNLQIVLSMLRSAGRDDPGTRERLSALAGRIQTLAQIHQLLYQRYDTTVPSLSSYVRELTGLLSEFYQMDIELAHVGTEVDDVDLALSQCIDFGLILNELVANAQKHAFGENEPGHISIEVLAEGLEGGPHVHLIVADDGIGLPAEFSLDSASSTGSRLLKGLAQQLNGEIWAERLSRGTAMHVRFPPNADAAARSD